MKVFCFISHTYSKIVIVNLTFLLRKLFAFDKLHKMQKFLNAIIGIPAALKIDLWFYRCCKRWWYLIILFSCLISKFYTWCKEVSKTELIIYFSLFLLINIRSAFNIFYYITSHSFPFYGMWYFPCKKCIS